jgi:hypothetical protein
MNQTPEGLSHSRRRRRRGSVGRRILFILCGLSIAVGVSAGDALADPAHHTVNLTLFSPLGINDDPNGSTNFRVSLLYGRVGSVRGVDLNGGVSIIERDLVGLQATLLYSQVGGQFRGLAATGLVNNFQSDGSGLQFAGLANVLRGHYTGLQFAGLMNFVQNGISGLQIAGVFNSSHGDSRFLQISALANQTENDFTGVQLGGLNVTGGIMNGAQVGLFNMAVETHGFQGALVNLAGEAHGLQIAPLNIMRRNYGVPVGLVNIDEENGNVDWIIFGSNLAAINSGVRTTVNRFYSMLTVGYGDLQGDVDNSLFLTWNYGYAIPLSDAWSIGLDLGFVHITPESSDDPDLNDELHFALQARALAEVRLGRKLAIFAGGGVSSVYSEYSSDASQETEPLFVAGVSLF